MKNNKVGCKFLSVFLAVILLISIMPFGVLTATAANTDFAGGNGTVEEPYLIETKEHLNNVRDNLSAHYKLISDIVFNDKDFAEGGAFYNNGKGWIPIGEYGVGSFSGSFNGDNHIIKGLYVYISTTSSGAAGLFGLCKNANISDLSVVDGNIFISSEKSSTYAGGVAAFFENGTVKNCFNSCKVVASDYSSKAGGIVGYATQSAIIDCCINSGEISATDTAGNSYAGGIAGEVCSKAVVTHCTNQGTVKADYCAGGIAGDIFTNGSIANCNNLGEITGNDYAGGISGFSRSKITYSSNCGEITTLASSSKAGGIVGMQNGGEVKYCYNTGLIYSDIKLGYFGGIVGASWHGSKIENSYNAGSITAENSTSGGIVGYIVYESIVNYVYNVGRVYSKRSLGGIAGYAMDGVDAAVITNSLYLDINDVGVGAGTDSTKKCTDKEMRELSTYDDFDFQNIWEFVENNKYLYPTLKENGYLLCEHSYVSKTTLPTCTEKGYTTYTCTCGDSYISDYVESTGHSHTAEVTTPATHTATGVMTYTCTCGDTYTETIGKIAEHSHNAVVTAPTCTEQGYTTYTCECGDSYVDDYVPEKGHDEGIWSVTKPSTPTESGVMHLFCGECGFVLETKVIPALGKVKSVSVSDVALHYKASATITPSITVDSGVKYTVTYSSSDPSVASIDANGKVVAGKTGSATITVTVTDEFGNTVSDTCEVKVNYNWWQWIIVIVLFGWIWY